MKIDSFILLVTVLFIVLTLFLMVKKENFDLFIGNVNSCVDNKNSVPLTNTIMFYPKITTTDENTVKIPKSLTHDNTHIYMNNSPSKYNDGIIYNSMYYTDNTFENTAKGGINYTQMMPKVKCTK